MSRISKKSLVAPRIAAISFTFFLAGSAVATPQTQTNTASPHILTLAGSCAACHGTNGLSTGGTPVLAGLDRGYFIKRMLAYKMQSTSTEVMPQQTQGLTSEEIMQLALYFAQQPRTFVHVIPKP